MFENKFICFLKKHKLYKEEVFNFIKNKTLLVDYKDERSVGFIGCFPVMENNIIKDIRLCIPRLVDDISVAINIHEYMHLLKMYNHLNCEYFFDNSEEVLPVIYEMIYLTDNSLLDYIAYYRDKINENDNDLYKYALSIWDKKANQLNRR